MQIQDQRRYAFGGGRPQSESRREYHWRQCMRRIQFAEKDLIAYGRPAHFTAQLHFQTVVFEKTQFFRHNERGAVRQKNKAHIQ